jgi:hypothetical protein
MRRESNREVMLSFTSRRTAVCVAFAGTDRHGDKQSLVMESDMRQSVCIHQQTGFSRQVQCTITFATGVRTSSYCDPISTIRHD